MYTVVASHLAACPRCDPGHQGPARLAPFWGELQVGLLRALLHLHVPCTYAGVRGSPPAVPFFAFGLCTLPQDASLSGAVWTNQLLWRGAWWAG